MNDYLNKLQAYKDMLASLPQNNIKNKKIYHENIKSIYDKEIIVLNDIHDEIKKRITSYLNVKENTEIPTLNKNINDIKQNLIITNNYASSYEKSGLDILLYNLTHYYKTDLSDIFETIEKVNDIFKSVNIILTAKDFNYSYYSNVFMNIYLNNKSSLEEKFDELYWKCPDIITHLALNYKYLYYQNIKIFEDHYNKINIDNIISSYQNFISKKDELIIQDKYLLLNDLLNGNKNIKDYEKVPSIINDLFTENLQENQYIDLYNSLIEYKEYNECLPIIKDIKESKTNSKNLSISIRKNIIKNEKKLFKENKKIIYSINKANSKKIQYYNNLINNNINLLKDMYEEYENALFLTKVNLLKEEDTIHNILLLACSNYNYLIEFTKKNNIDFNYIYNILIHIVYSPYNNLINNLFIKDEKDLSLIIIDKYNLYGGKLNKEMLTKDNIDNLINNLKLVIDNFYIKKYNITEEKISFIKEGREL
ncbi:MAG: hypothetical protein SPE00_03225 [Bacilli bacterium]|nr:hypothetical protein [Bacilli bacterium]